MRRYHVVEFEDLPWFPSILRDYTTDFLQFMVNHFDFYQGLVPIISRGMEAAGSDNIIDLASGGGGGWRGIIQPLQALHPDLKITLTDRYPNVQAFTALESQYGDTVRPVTASVDALAVPPELTGLRTQFLSFHHFRPEAARQILQNAVDQRAPLLIVEIQNRDGVNLLKHMLSPVSVLLTAPFIRPFRWGRLFLTWVLPVLPFVVWWDGLASVLRTYSEEEIRTMIASLDGGEKYNWEIDCDRGGPAPVYYVAGFPNERG